MKSIIISIIIAVAIIGGAIILGKSPNISDVSDNIPVNNVSIVDGKQIIEIRAKGGYQPRTSLAKAGLQTIIRFNTNGTFDCSSSVRIPSLNITKVLPQSGTTDIDIGIGSVGKLAGTCGMGMYPFEINFQS